MDWDAIAQEMEEFVENLEGEDTPLVSTEAPAGGSNAGKYKTSGPYCGPAGGAPAKTYPVNTRKRAVAALAYARNAPNPAGIKRCVCRHWRDLPACKKKDSETDVRATVKKLLASGDIETALGLMKKHNIATF